MSHSMTGSKKSKPNIIAVTGEGKVSVEPNEADVTLGASTENPSLAIAQERNAQTIARIKDGLYHLGILDTDIKTVNYTIIPQYDFKEGNTVFKGYKVDHLLRIKVRSAQNTGIIVDTAVRSGANIVTGIQFDSSDRDYFYRQALSLAVLDAVRKAETVARTLHVRLVQEPQSLKEVLLPGEPVPVFGQPFVKSASSTPIQPGTLELAGYVTAEFLYRKND